MGSLSADRAGVPVSCHDGTMKRSRKEGEEKWVMVCPMRRWWYVVGDLWIHGVGCMACATWWGVMRSERVDCMMCVMEGGGVQVDTACGAWGCRKVRTV